MRKLRPESGGSPRVASEAWRKYGTMERVLRDIGGPSGEQLHPMEKLIAAYLLTYGHTAEADPRAMLDLEKPRIIATGEDREPSIEEALGLTGKSIRKYLGALERRGLIEQRRDRKNGGVSVYLRGLVEAFREVRNGADVRSLSEARIGKISRTDGSAEDAPVREILADGSGNRSGGPGNYPDPERETIPIPLELSPFELNKTSTEHAALARRLGFEITENPDGSAHVAFFANRPFRYAAAHLVATTVAEWGVTTRRIRALIRDYTFHGVAGAVAYVLEQVERGRQGSLLSEDERKRLDLPEVRKPGALLEVALANGWASTLPGFEQDEESARSGGQSFEVDLWTTIREMLRRRVSAATFEVAFKVVTLRAREGAFALHVVNGAAAVLARKSIDKVAQCFATVGYPNAEILVTTEDA